MLWAPRLSSPKQAGMTDAHFTQPLEALTALLGSKGFTTDADVMAPWLIDQRGKYSGNAFGMASPNSVEEVQAIVRLAHAGGFVIVPQGGNSGMVAGATPITDRPALLLSLRRMNRIRDIAPEQGRITAEAGVILEHLHEEALRHGQRFPLSLGAKGSATVGGLVSTNAGGTQVLRHGPMRSLVLGLEAVLPDGSLYEGLAALKKDNRGYSLNHLLIGAEGTLGIVTAATLKTVPAFSERHVVWAGAASPQAALQALHRLDADLKGALEGYELIPGSALKNVVAHLPGAIAPLSPNIPWHILIEAVAAADNSAAILDRLQHTLADLIEDSQYSDAVIAKNEAEATAWWTLRESISESERAHGPALQHDISVPVDRMPDFLTQDANAIAAEFPGLVMMGFGHLGDGNIHLHAQPPRENADKGAAWLAQYGKAVSARVYEQVKAAGGSLSAEHGIGRDKRDIFVDLEDPARIAALAAIKQALDPDAIFNPGALLR